MAVVLLLEGRSDRNSLLSIKTVQASSKSAGSPLGQNICKRNPFEKITGSVLPPKVRCMSNPRVVAQRDFIIKRRFPSLVFEYCCQCRETVGTSRHVTGTGANTTKLRYSVGVRVRAIERRRQSCSNSR